MGAVTQELPNQELLKSVFKDIAGIMGEPGKQPRDYQRPLHPWGNFDGRHAAGFSPGLKTIKPSDVGMDDAKFSTGNPDMWVNLAWMFMR